MADAFIGFNTPCGISPTTSWSAAGVAHIHFSCKIAHIGFCAVTGVLRSVLSHSLSIIVHIRFCQISVLCFIRPFLKAPYPNKSSVLNKSITFTERSSDIWVISY